MMARPVVHLQKGLSEVIMAISINFIIAATAHGRGKTNGVGVKLPDVRPLFFNSFVKRVDLTIGSVGFPDI